MKSEFRLIKGTIQSHGPTKTAPDRSSKVFDEIRIETVEGQKVHIRKVAAAWDISLELKPGVTGEFLVQTVPKKGSVVHAVRTSDGETVWDVLVEEAAFEREKKKGSLVKAAIFYIVLGIPGLLLLVGAILILGGVWLLIADYINKSRLTQTRADGIAAAKEHGFSLEEPEYI